MTRIRSWVGVSLLMVSAMACGRTDLDTAFLIGPDSEDDQVNDLPAPTPEPTPDQPSPDIPTSEETPEVPDEEETTTSMDDLPSMSDLPDEPKPSPFIWESIGGEGAYFDLATDHIGNTVAVGRAEDGMAVGYVSKYDHAGNLLWEEAQPEARRIQKSYVSVVVDGDGRTVTVGANDGATEGYVSIYDQSNEHLVTRTYRGNILYGIMEHPLEDGFLGIGGLTDGNPGAIATDFYNRIFRVWTDGRIYDEYSGCGPTRSRGLGIAWGGGESLFLRSEGEFGDGDGDGDIVISRSRCSIWDGSVIEAAQQVAMSAEGPFANFLDGHSGGIVVDPSIGAFTIAQHQPETSILQAHATDFGRDWVKIVPGVARGVALGIFGVIYVVGYDEDRNGFVAQYDIHSGEELDSETFEIDEPSPRDGIFDILFTDRNSLILAGRKEGQRWIAEYAL